MKRILLLSFILLSTSLFSRVNPFEPTNTYIDEQQTYLKKIKEEKELQRQQKLEDALKEIEQEIVIIEDKEIIEKSIEYVKDNFNPLSFVSLYTVQNNLMIEVNKKYIFLQNIILPEQNKILFDFKGDESFYTIRQKLKNPNYKSFAIGTHQKENFFRVVVDLENKTQNYKATIDKKNNIIVIQPYIKKEVLP